MADTKVSALSSFTPVATDLLYGVDDPSGTPASGNFAISALDSVMFGGLFTAGTNAIEQRNGSNAQSFSVYNSYTDASNNERAFLEWSGNALKIGAEANGTGSTANTEVHFTTEDRYLWYRSGAVLALLDNNVFRPSGSVLGLGQTGSEWVDLYVDNFVSIKANDTVANLPTGTTGKITWVNDASSPSIGSTVTGGGAATALVWYNGSAWTVIGV